jgi:hypothetical protein
VTTFDNLPKAFASFQRICLPVAERFLAFGLYYKPMTIVHDDFRAIHKLEASLTDDTRVIIYDHHMFIVQSTGYDDV